MYGRDAKHRFQNVQIEMTISSNAEMAIRLAVSVQFLGFGEYGHLTPPRRLIAASCSSGQSFAIGLPSDSQSPAKPLSLAKSSPCLARDCDLGPTIGIIQNGSNRLRAAGNSRTWRKGI